MRSGYYASESCPAQGLLPLKSLKWLDKVPEEQSVYAWDWKAGIAFWASVFSLQGSLLFLIGSVAMYPGLVSGKSETAWVDYPFMIGAWCFLVTNYLIYFNAINKHHAGGVLLPLPGEHVSKRRFVAFPSDQGELAAVLSLIGAVLYNFNTMSMYVDQSTWWSYTLWYVATGSIGAAFFSASAILEGEYNAWRHPSMETLRSIPVWQSLFNLMGGLTYCCSYSSAFDHYGGASPSRDIALIVAPFVIGSVCYFVSSLLDVIMWKKQLFGLGFAKELKFVSDRSLKHTENPLQPSGVACPWQMGALMVYIAILCMAWCRVGQVAAGCRLGTDIGIVFLQVIRLLVTYNTILWLMTVLHRTPAQPPYNYLLWLMRFSAVVDMIGQFDLLWKGVILKAD